MTGAAVSNPAFLFVKEPVFVAVLNSLNEGLLLADQNGIIQFVNSQYENITGYTPQEIVGKKVYEIFYPSGTKEREEAETAMEQRYKSRLEGKSEIYENYIFTKDGKRKWIENRASPLHSADGKIIGSVGSTIDITTRKIMEDQFLQVGRMHFYTSLAEQEASSNGDQSLNGNLSSEVHAALNADQKGDFNPLAYGIKIGLTAISESLNEGLGIADRDGNVSYVNSRFCEITGYSKEEIIGKKTFEIYFPENSDDRKNDAKSMDKRYHHRRKGISEVYETEIVRKDGIRRWIETKASPMLDNWGNVIGSVGAIIDNTDQRILEEQLRWSQKMEAVGRLAGGVAHDFNNLLTVIQGYSSDLKSQLQPNPEQYRKAGVILEASEAAGALTQQLLSISRRQVIQMTPVSLNDVVERSIGVIRGLMGDRIETNVELSPDLPLTVADASQLQQILINLAVNARDAMPEGGNLRIFTNLVSKYGQPISSPSHGSENFVRLRVEDTGHGINDEIKTKIFEPFFTTKRGTGRGSGLGLSIAFSIVKDHKGELRLESKPGEGARFDVLLPVDLEKQAEAAAQRKDWKPLTGSEVVLLAEDQMGVRVLVKDTLERFGYKVFDAGDGVEALELASGLERIDMLVTDLVMPRIGGLQLATELAALRPGIGLVVISGYPDERDVWKKLNDLGCEFMAKPFSPEALARLVRKVLDKKLAQIAQ